MKDALANGAVFSADNTYRWYLWRTLNKGDGKLCFIMLNPSKADANDDDPTIRRCKGFARRWGYKQIHIVNLFGLIATDPKELKRVANNTGDVVGWKNNDYIDQIARQSAMVVCAWGRVAPSLVYRVSQVKRILWDVGNAVYCLGTNKDGSPKHPLFLKNATEPLEWSAFPRQKSLPKRAF